MSEWAKSEKYLRRGKGFCVEVSRHEVKPTDERDDRGRFRWCVYAYIYPTHQLFQAAMDYMTPGSNEDAIRALTMHGGVTLKHVIMMDGDRTEVSSVQLGCNYNHLDDERFTHYETKEDAVCVFLDANMLFNELGGK